MLVATILQLSLLSVKIASALPSGTTTTSVSTRADRYVPGSFSTASQGIVLDDDGALNVGFDGVLRSFRPNGTVVDFRQLDPDQVAEYAARQLAGWGSEVPDSLKALVANASAIDGRLVTDHDQLFHPADKPAFPKVPKRRDSLNPVAPTCIIYRGASGNVGSRSGNLEERDCIPHECAVGTDCQSLAECRQVGCLACYFEHGPPNGRCFPN